MLVRHKDAQAVARAAAGAVVEAAFRASHEHGNFRLVLAGGRTPRAAYELLAGEMRDEVDWRRVTLFFGDERCVPPTDEASNYRMVRETLVDPLKLPSSAVHHMAGAIAPDNAAAEYDFEVRRAVEERRPAFDLVLLGMGPEGHTASLFPGSPALEERHKMALHVTVPATPSERITMTPPALSSTRQILFLVTGEDKADAIAAVFKDESDLPAAVVSRLAPSRFLVDEAAASRVAF
ncbi:MAG TPA: 6-phosphogluconolactonase [Candidatus Dormibacteraeota bacterium]|jgi:6-phosphogluconolactonase